MNILGTPTATKDQIKQYVKNLGNKAHPLAIAMVDLLWDGAIEHGIDPVVLSSQAFKETGYFTFKGVINPSFCNTCGLKIHEGGGDKDPNAHMRFPRWETGIKAHAEHLCLYAGAEGYPLPNPVDPRHFSSIFGKAKNTVEGLEEWATGCGYGKDIERICNLIQNTKIEVNENINTEDLNKLKKELEEANSNICTLENKLSESIDIIDSYNQLKKVIHKLIN